jgi:hypothetical protein
MRTRTNPARARSAALNLFYGTVIAAFGVLMAEASRDLAVLAGVAALGFLLIAFHKFSTPRQP